LKGYNLLEVCTTCTFSGAKKKIVRGIKKQEHQCQIKIFGLIKPSSSKNGRLTRNYKDKTRCIKSKVNTNNSRVI